MAECPKNVMTDNERMELAARLDRELDVFIEGLERTRYTEGWPEDRWEEEMDKHPFFMKKAPEPGEELHPLLEGLQQLKYDPDENTAEELAIKYKADGNFYMKSKKFRLSIMCFTEALNANSTNNELNATLYNNRSAAHFFLQNYRSSLHDAEKALKINANYSKSKLRAAQCCFFTGKYDLCIQYCEDMLEEDPTDEKATELLKQCQAKKLENMRNARKQAIINKRKQAELERLIKSLKIRNVKFDDIPHDKELTHELLKPELLPLEEHPVSADENGTLYWPTAFCYPEFLFSDFQQQLCEDTTMKESIDTMFTESLPDDKDGNYRSGNVNVYYENRIDGTVHKVEMKKTITAILQEKDFYVNGGCLVFYIVPIGSIVEKKFINEKRRELVCYDVK